MAARPTWKGFLKISLVNIPIKVFPATDSAATISFNQLHGECQTRIQQKRWCPKCEREVPISEVVKGYEFEKGRYVVMDEEDIEKVRPESTRVIDLVQFTDDTAIDPIYVERPYYLAPGRPDGAGGVRGHARGHERARPASASWRSTAASTWSRCSRKDKGLVMYTLRHANEIRSMDAIEELTACRRRSSRTKSSSRKQVIGTFEGQLDLSRLQGRLPGGAAADHRREDRRRGGRRAERARRRRRSST